MSDANRGTPEWREAQRARYERLKTIQPQQRIFWPVGTYCRWISAHKAAIREDAKRERAKEFKARRKLGDLYLRAWLKFEASR